MRNRAVRNVKSVYWTIITIDEQVKELDKELLAILSQNNFTRVESRIIRGNICQLFLQKNRLVKEESSELKIKDESGRVPYIVELSS